MKSLKRILIVRTDRVGDVVYITPAIRELRRSFPDAFIATLTQPHTKNILVNNPHLDAMLTDDLSKESYWDVVKEIGRYKFTHALLMLPTERAAYQLFLAGIPGRIGVGHKLYELITFMSSVSRHNYTPLRHESDYCMDLARKIGAVPAERGLELFVTDDERRQGERCLAEAGVAKNDITIMAHIGSLGSAPNWSEGKYLALLKSLLATYAHLPLKILLTAREMSADFLAEITAMNDPRVINLVPQLDDLRTFIQAISVVDIFFGPSTGPLHIADGLNIACIGLHCHRPMNCAVHQGVLNSRSMNLETPAAYCAANCSTDYKQCAFEEGISIEMVMAAFDSQLQCFSNNGNALL